MKYLLTLLAVLLVTGASYAQTDSVISYLDYWWKPCDKAIAQYKRVVYIEPGLWHVRNYYAAEGTFQKEVYYTDAQLQTLNGKAVFFYPNGQLQKAVQYINGNVDGVVKEYNLYGKLIDSAFYKKGIPCKYHYKWNDSGMVAFIGIYDNAGNGSGTETGYYDDGKRSFNGVTKTGYIKDSIWTFYTTGGIVSCQDAYDESHRLTRMCYNRNGMMYAGKCEDTLARPVESREWIIKKITQAYKEGRTDAKTKKPKPEITFPANAYVVLKADIDEQGAIVNTDVVHKLHPEADNIILKTFNDNMKFKPAMEGNRPVKSSFEWSVKVFNDSSGFRIE